MNKKDKIEARKAIFDMHKVFIICTFLYSNMVINYDKSYRPLLEFNHKYFEIFIHI